MQSLTIYITPLEDSQNTFAFRFLSSTLLHIICIRTFPKRFTNGHASASFSCTFKTACSKRLQVSFQGIAAKPLKIWTQKSVKIKTLRKMFMEEILPRLTWRIFLICFYSLLGVHIISQLASRISSINYRPKFWQPPDSFSATSVLKKAVLLSLFNTTHQANPETKKEVFEFFVNFCGRRCVSFFYLWVMFHLHDATHLTFSAFWVHKNLSVVQEKSRFPKYERPTARLLKFLAPPAQKWSLNWEHERTSNKFFQANF